MAGEFVRFSCAFCNPRTDDDAQYVYVSWTGPSQGRKSHSGRLRHACRATIHQSMPLAVEQRLAVIDVRS